MAEEHRRAHGARREPALGQPDPSSTCDELDLNTVIRDISQNVCPWNVKFSQELAADSRFKALELIAGKDSPTLARDILALDRQQFSAAFRKSPIKRATLRGLQRNAAVVLHNTASEYSA